MGIELKATLKTRKLLIPLNAKNAKNIEFAQARYTAGTRGKHRQGVEIGFGAFKGLLLHSCDAGQHGGGHQYQ